MSSGENQAESWPAMTASWSPRVLRASRQKPCGEDAQKTLSGAVKFQHGMRLPEAGDFRFTSPWAIKVLQTWRSKEQTIPKSIAHQMRDYLLEGRYSLTFQEFIGWMEKQANKGDWAAFLCGREFWREEKRHSAIAEELAKTWPVLTPGKDADALMKDNYPPTWPDKAPAVYKKQSEWIDRLKEWKALSKWVSIESWIEDKSVEPGWEEEFKKYLQEETKDGTMEAVDALIDILVKHMEKHQAVALKQAEVNASERRARMKPRFSSFSQPLQEPDATVQTGSKRSAPSEDLFDEDLAKRLRSSRVSQAQNTPDLDKRMKALEERMGQLHDSQRKSATLLMVFLDHHGYDMSKLKD